jgi:hypothetical protein
MGKALATAAESERRARRVKLWQELFKELLRRRRDGSSVPYFVAEADLPEYIVSKRQLADGHMPGCHLSNSYGSCHGHLPQGKQAGSRLAKTEA